MVPSAPPAAPLFVPAEIISLIVHHVRHSSTALTKAERATLSQCCLVSKAFLPQSRHELYLIAELKFGSHNPARAPKDHTRLGHALEVGLDRPSTRLSHTLVLHPHLARLVRRIHLDVDCEWYEYRDSGLPSVALAGTLHSCPNVDAIHLIGALYGDTFASLAWLIPLLRPSLRILEVHPIEHSGLMASQALLVLLRRLPGLLHLTFGRIAFTDTPLQPPPFSLRHFEIAYPSYRPREDWEAAFNYVMASSHRSLRTAQLPVTSGDKGSYDLTPFARLAELTLTFFEAIETHPTPLLVQARYNAVARSALVSFRNQLQLLPPSLRRVVIHDRDSQLPPALVADVRLLEHLPLNVHTVELRGLRVSTDYLATFLERLEGARWKLLIVLKDAAAVNSAGWERVQLACEQRGISLIVKCR